MKLSKERLVTFGVCSGVFLLIVLPLMLAILPGAPTWVKWPSWLSAFIGLVVIIGAGMMAFIWDSEGENW